jgi:hypothetical protein
MQSIKTLVAIAGLLFGTVAAQEVTEEEPGVFATRPLTSRAAMAPSQLLSIRASTGLSGSISVNTIDTSAAIAVYTKEAKTLRRRRAIDFIDQIAVDFVKIPEGLRLELRAPNPPPWESGEAGIINLQITLPQGSRLDVDATYFDMDVTGPLSRVVNTSSLGRLQVRRVNGETDLATANRRIDVEELTGYIALSTTNAPLTAERLVAVPEDATFRNENASIRIDSLIGGANVRTTFARIEVERLYCNDARSYIRCSHGPIRVAVGELGDGRLVVNNEYEDIEIEVPADLNATLSLAVDELGKIEASGFPFQSELVRPNRLNLVVGEGEGWITASVSRDGNIYMRGINQGE